MRNFSLLIFTIFSLNLAQAMEIIPAEILTEILEKIPQNHKNYKDKVNSLLPIRLVCKKFLKISDNLLLQTCDAHLSRQFLVKKTNNPQKLEVITIEDKLKMAFINDIAFYILKNQNNININGHLFLNACIRDRINIAKMALGLGININTIDANGNSGLKLASLYNSNKVFHYLLAQEGFDPNLISQYGDSALSNAISNNNKDFAIQLLKKGTKYDKSTYTILEIRNNNKMLLSMPQNREELITALETNNLFPH